MRILVNLLEGILVLPTWIVPLRSCGCIFCVFILSVLLSYWSFTEGLLFSALRGLRLVFSPLLISFLLPFSLPLSFPPLRELLQLPLHPSSPPLSFVFALRPQHFIPCLPLLQHLHPLHSFSLLLPRQHLLSVWLQLPLPRLASSLPLRPLSSWQWLLA